jgi:hypothetical protein
MTADFLPVLQHVVGQPLEAARYQLEDTPMHHARGLFRFHKELEDATHAFIEFQTIYHPQSDLSRFRISLLRNDQPQARIASAAAEERSLAHIIWHEYEARILPADEHWWTYKSAEDLAYHLYEAGKLVFAYGVPWLEHFEDEE